tara:strand:+ start:516 stop:905 length:390 start_codon:yes stop_codon:yes gene_type:complete
MLEKFTVEIISPDSSIIKTDATEVTIPSYEGEMGILKDHIALITFLRPGLVKIKKEESDKSFFIEDGTVEFADNKLLILTSTAKDLLNMNKSAMNTLINDAEMKLNDNEITDKEKYLLTHKINTLKNIT